MTKRIDEAYGRLIDSLLSLKLMDESVLFFTSDHGNNFKTRNEEYKRSCHESSIRVPSSVIGNVFEQGGRIKNLISILDIHATILDIADVKNFQSDGKSILPLVMKKNIKWIDEIFIQISESQVGRSLRTKKWKYSVNSPESDPWNDQGSNQYLEQFLYNLDADPYELNNLIGIKEFNTITKKLRDKLTQYINKHENLKTNIKKANNVNNPGQLGLEPGSFMDGY